MKYYITFSCGHEGCVTLYGKASDREKRLEYLKAAALCPACEEKQKKELEEKNYKNKLLTGEIIMPNEQTSKNIVTIEVKGNVAFAKAGKDDNLRKLYKENGYSWNYDEYRWEYPCVKERDGEAEDRAAELANAVLLKGYPVKIVDESIKEKAINATFKPRSLRWIIASKKEKEEWCLTILLEPNNEELYQAARALPYSQWNKSYKGVSVNPQFFKEVSEFADIYGYQFSKGAIELMQNAENLAIKSSRVNVQSVKEQQNKGLKSILDEPANVLEDLRDD